MRAFHRAVAAIAPVVLSLAAAASAAAAGGALQVTGAPALYPAFRPGAYDYVARCRGSDGLRLSVSAPQGESVSVDGAPARSGSFEATVPIRANQSTAVVAHSSQITARYHMRCLPESFPPWTARRTGAPQAQWYLLSPGLTWEAFFDARGVPVWWKHSTDSIFNPTLLDDGHVAWYPVPPDAKFGVSTTDYEEHRLDGGKVRTIGAVGVPTDLHELQQLPNGHYLVDAYRPRRGVDLSAFGGPRKALVYFAEIQELTRTGKLVWRWNARGRIALKETGHWWPGFVANQKKHPPSTRSYDPMHINSISPIGHDLVISCRHTDALYRIDRSTGRVMWKLGGTHTKRSLKIVGDPAYGKVDFGGQHDVRVLPDKTISIYDNGAGRNRPPRALRFRIDAKHRSARLLEELSDPDVDESTWGGSARRLPGGDWVTAWGGTNYVTEMTPAGTRVLQLEFPLATPYRAQALAPGRISAATLRAAMDRRYPRGG